MREVQLSDTGWLPIALCPTDGVFRRVLLPDGNEAVAAFDGGAWRTEKQVEYDEPVYEEQLKGGFIPSFEPRPAPRQLPRKKIGARKAFMRLIGRLPDGVYPTHFRPNDTVYGRAALPHKGEESR